MFWEEKQAQQRQQVSRKRRWCRRRAEACRIYTGEEQEREETLGPPSPRARGYHEQCLRRPIRELHVETGGEGAQSV